VSCDLFSIITPSAALSSSIVISSRIVAAHFHAMIASSRISRFADAQDSIPSLDIRSKRSWHLFWI